MHERTLGLALGLVAWSAPFAATGRAQAAGEACLVQEAKLLPSDGAPSS